MSGHDVTAAAWMRPEWPVPPSVGALMTTRAGGISAAPYDSLNLGDHVGDAPDAVAGNRARLVAVLRAEPVFLRQVHGTKVVHLRPEHTRSGMPVEADAALATEPGLACTVMVADCLPVLFASPDGRAVAAAHAGWRGLAAGVLDHTVAALCVAGGCEPADLLAWLGPCIGADSFEVGDDVRQVFRQAQAGAALRFRSGARAGKWWADLPGLARDRLAAAGVVKVGGGHWCTVEDRSRFFSFRRDGVTGRMAAAVWIADGRRR
ncbi:peptidoglycan editing factor PgeF [Schlegelella sp. S2-27]|uniref:Purine nucleoside phosphorylase n=1 Tax=Caldimonas mangrovi TaxID=2944811 RepID=A0ABT0YTE0_9BURK|nr:peptidoglycan editing factor PgeF [Caldimonas mangrovi]MCM5682028.1 peptidoglycan editing factor PgeF [Caldimonas mangrovi]